MQMREKVGKSRHTVFFQWFVAPEGRKVGSLKRRVRRQLARWEMKNCTPLWREAHFEVKRYKTPQCRTTFGSCDVEKVHAVVARSTFRSAHVQSTSVSDHVWKLWCRKCARRCGAKHISKWKCTKHLSVGPLLEVRCGAKHISKWTCTKHLSVGPLLEVEMPKKCTPLWREAHFEVKTLKTPHVCATFGGSDVEKVHAVVARSTFRSQNVRNTRGSDHFWRFRCRFASLHYTTLHYTTLHSTTLHYTTLHYTTLHYNYNYTTTLHYTPLHSTTLNYATLHYITLHYTPMHYTTLHYTTLPSTTLHYTTLNYTPLHYNYNYTTTQLHSTTLHYTKLHYTTLHYTPLHYSTLRYTTLHYATFHYTSLHYTTLHYTTTTYNYNYTTTLHYTPVH